MELYQFHQGHDELRGEDRFHVNGHCRPGEHIKITLVGTDGTEHSLRSFGYPFAWYFCCLITSGRLIKWEEFPQNTDTMDNATPLVRIARALWMALRRRLHNLFNSRQRGVEQW